MLIAFEGCSHREAAQILEVTKKPWKHASTTLGTNSPAWSQHLTSMTC
jgi:hypothetical protein